MPTARQLETFLCVADSGSMRVAADRLGISQPSISKHIQALEAKLGRPLFERRRGARIALSEQGELLLSDAQKMLDLQRGLQRLGAAGEPPRKLNVLVRQYLFSTIECELGDTRLAQSGFELSFEVIDKQDLVEEVALRGLDAIALLRGARPISHPQLTTSVLRVDSCSVYASPSFVAHCSTAGEMLPQCRVLIPQEGLYREWVARQLSSLGVPTENMEEAAWYPRAVLRRVVDSDAAAIFLDNHVSSLVAAGKLQAMLGPTAPLYLQVVCSRLISPDVRAEMIAKIENLFVDGSVPAELPSG